MTNCTKLKLKFEFQHNDQTPFGMSINWENPTIKQIVSVKHSIIKLFDDEIEVLSSSVTKKEGDI